MKATIELGYKSYVMDAEKAIAVLEMLDQAEMYETKWVNKSTAHYIYPQEGSDNIRTLKILPDALYKMAKMAGRPNQD